MKIRRLFAIFAVLCLLLTACTGTPKGDPTTTVATTTTTEATTTTVTTTVPTTTTTRSTTKTTTTTAKPTTVTLPATTTMLPTWTAIVTKPSAAATTTTVTTTTTKRTTSTYTTGTVGTTVYTPQGDTVAASTPVLYKVTSSKGKNIWLFGSIHVGTEELYPLPEYVQNAFDNAEALAVEFDLIEYSDDVYAQWQAQEMMRLPDDTTTTADYIDPTLYHYASAILKAYGVDITQLDHYYPIFWSQLIDSIISGMTLPDIGAESDLGVDMTLLTLAKERDMQIVEIESAYRQSKMLADFSISLQESLLASSVYEYLNGPTADSTQDMLDMWAAGDVNVLNEYLTVDYDNSMSAEQKRIQAEYQQKMIVERNNDMTAYAIQALEAEHEVFICVGLAHVLGDTGLAVQLNEYGYTVQQVIG